MNNSHSIATTSSDTFWALADVAVHKGGGNKYHQQPEDVPGQAQTLPRCGVPPAEHVTLLKSCLIVSCDSIALHSELTEPEAADPARSGRSRSHARSPTDLLCTGAPINGLRWHLV